MAQYGSNRHFYGASYYGVKGAFAGQYISDKTFLEPLSENGALQFDIYTKLDTLSYAHTSNLFLYQGEWIISGSMRGSSDSNFKITTTLTASDITIHSRSRANGATADIVITPIISTGLDVANAITHKLDTKTTGFLNIPLTFGDYQIQISRSVGSVGVFDFEKISAITNDVAIEMQYTLEGIESDNWSGWRIKLDGSDNTINLIRTYDSKTGLFKFSGVSSIITGASGYRFVLHLASSDSTSSPEIMKLDIHTPNNNHYSDDGFWKILIDLGSSVTDIKSIDFNATTPEGTKLEIRSRASNDLNTWLPWTVPYSDSPKRILLDTKVNSNLRTGYIITPLIDPINLNKWDILSPELFINDRDPLTNAFLTGTQVKISLLDEYKNVIYGDEYFWDSTTKQKLRMPKTYVFTSMNDVLRIIEDVGQKIRIKIDIFKSLSTTTPAIDSLYLAATAIYKEVKNFGDGGLESYASLVFNNNTGRDIVYIDGTTRKLVASISNLGFSIPTAHKFGVNNYITDIEYSISTKLPEGISKQVDVFWSVDRNSKTIILPLHTDSDYLIAEVKEDGTHVKRHIYNGSGITTKIENTGIENHDSVIVSNAFWPALDNKKYAYFITNGFSGDASTINPGVDIRWSYENSLDIGARRYITYPIQGNENTYTLYVSISNPSEGGLKEWVSEERIFEAKVNTGSPSIKKDTRITLTNADILPEIPPDAIVDANPYKIEIIDGSVVSEGQIRENSRINLNMTNVTDSTKTHTELKAVMIKGDSNIDILPKAKTIRIIGIYNIENGSSPWRQEGLHFNLIKDPGKNYGSRIEWVLNTPAPGTKLWVDYEFYGVDNLHIVASSDYKKKSYSAMNIYRTNSIEYDGVCSFGIDYKSDQYNIGDLWPSIPETVDKSTLKLKVLSTENSFVNVYVDDDRVIGTLEGMNPKDNWYPEIKEGNYYIGKDALYLFTSPYSATISKETVPRAENIEYNLYGNNKGILIQEATTNLFTNPSFRSNNLLKQSFVDGFGR